MGNFNNENLIPFTGELKSGQRLLKRPDGYFIPVGASAGSNVVAGYFADKDGNGLKFYPTGSNNGESVNQIMIADTGENEPQYEGGNSMDFYKCASITAPGILVSGAGIDEVNGTYIDYGTVYQGKSLYSNSNNYLLYYETRWGSPWWVIHTQTEINDAVKFLYITYSESPFDSPWYTGHSGIGNAPTVIATIPENNVWTGYKAIKNSSTGEWSFNQNITSGLEYNGYVPKIGDIYNEDATIKVEFSSLSE